MSEREGASVISYSMCLILSQKGRRRWRVKLIATPAANTNGVKLSKIKFVYVKVPLGLSARDQQCRIGCTLPVSQHKITWNLKRAPSHEIATNCGKRNSQWQQQPQTTRRSVMKMPFCYFLPWVSHTHVRLTFGENIAWNLRYDRARKHIYS